MSCFRGSEKDAVVGSMRDGRAVAFTEPREDPSAPSQPETTVNSPRLAGGDCCGAGMVLCTDVLVPCLPHKAVFSQRPALCDYSCALYMAWDDLLPESLKKGVDK